MTGAWIAIDGTDAVGKTTQLGLLDNALRTAQHNVSVSAEFSSSGLGMALARNVRKNRFLSLGGGGSTPWADTLALLADLAFKVESEVIQTLEAGGFHLSDRGLLSLCAYQADRIRRTGNGEITTRLLSELVMAVASYLRVPDLHILLTGSIPTLEGRARSREGLGWSASEREFIARVQDEMILLADASAIDTIVCGIDGLSEEQLHGAILLKLRRLGYI